MLKPYNMNTFTIYLYRWTIQTWRLNTSQLHREMRLWGSARVTDRFDSDMITYISPLHKVMAIDMMTLVWHFIR